MQSVHDCDKEIDNAQLGRRWSPVSIAGLTIYEIF